MVNTNMKAPTIPSMRQSKYIPKIGDTITVELPDERTRCEIVKIVSDEAVIAKLLTFTTAIHSHNYKKGDLVAARFEKSGMGQMRWRLVSEQELDRLSAPAETEEAQADELAERVEAEAVEEPPIVSDEGALREMTEADL